MNDQLVKRLTLSRFVANEKWRKEFGTDSLPQTFNYTEKPEVFKYYPQYYHKTDKVSSTHHNLNLCI